MWTLQYTTVIPKGVKGFTSFCGHRLQMLVGARKFSHWHLSQRNVIIALIATSSGLQLKPVSLPQPTHIILDNNNHLQIGAIIKLGKLLHYTDLHRCSKILPPINLPNIYALAKLSCCYIHITSKFFGGKNDSLQKKKKWWIWDEIKY